MFEESKDYVIIGKNACPYCTQAELLLESNGLRYEYHIFNETPELLDFVKNELKVNTVPQIRTPDGLWIGGYEQLKARIG